jgi:hypothetical protein
MENLNTREYLEKNVMRIVENLRHLQHAPSVVLGEVRACVAGVA